MAFTRKLKIGMLDKFVHFDDSMTLADLKTEIQRQAGIDPEDCRLVIEGKNLFKDPNYLNKTIHEIEISSKMLFGSSSTGLVYRPKVQPPSRIEEDKALPGAAPNTVQAVKNGPSLSENKIPSPATTTSTKKESALGKVGTFGTINTGQQPKEKSLLQRLQRLLNSSNDDSPPPSYRGKSK